MNFSKFSQICLILINLTQNSQTTPAANTLTTPAPAQVSDEEHNKMMEEMELKKTEFSTCLSKVEKVKTILTPTIQAHKKSEKDTNTRIMDSMKVSLSLIETAQQLAKKSNKNNLKKSDATPKPEEPKVTDPKPEDKPKEEEKPEDKKIESNLIDSFVKESMAFVEKTQQKLDTMQNEAFKKFDDILIELTQQIKKRKFNVQILNQTNAFFRFKAKLMTAIQDPVEGLDLTLLKTELKALMVSTEALGADMTKAALDQLEILKTLEAQIESIMSLQDTIKVLASKVEEGLSDSLMKLDVNDGSADMAKLDKSIEKCYNVVDDIIVSVDSVVMTKK